VIVRTITDKMLGYIGNKIGKWIILEVGKRINSRQYFWAKCDCGTIRELCVNDLTRTKRERGSEVPSCGCYILENKLNKQNKHIGKRFNKLVIIGEPSRKVKPDGTFKVYLLCKCDCGTTKNILKKDLFRNRVLSCGCLRQENLAKKHNDLIGEKFGKLTVISNVGVIETRLHCRVLCECGEKLIVKANSIQCGNIQSCGNCGLFRNSVKTSWIALKLNEMIPNGLHNYFTDIPTKNGRTLNVDIALPNEKIVIEYDSIRYHSTLKNFYEDIEKTNKLTQAGWKVLRIISRDKLPGQAELDNYLDELRNGKNLLIVRL